jgi:hypothetical protein
MDTKVGPSVDDTLQGANPNGFSQWEPPIWDPQMETHPGDIAEVTKSGGSLLVNPMLWTSFRGSPAVDNQHWTPCS